MAYFGRVAFGAAKADGSRFATAGATFTKSLRSRIIFIKPSRANYIEKRRAIQVEDYFFVKSSRTSTLFLSSVRSFSIELARSAAA